MTTKQKITDDGRTVTVRVSISIQKRGGRKLVLAPYGAEVDTTPVAQHVDNAMVKAIARAFRWREMLENGEYATIREIARAERINESYVGRILRLTLLSPEVIEALVNGRLPRGLELGLLMHGFSTNWSEQGHFFPT